MTGPDCQAYRTGSEEHGATGGPRNRLGVDAPVQRGPLCLDELMDEG